MHPVWNRRFVFVSTSVASWLYAEVWDKDTNSDDDFIGYAAPPCPTYQLIHTTVCRTVYA